MQIPYGDLELDKIPGAWVLTYWLSTDIALRLKVRHSSAGDPDDYVAEVRLGADEDFQGVHEFSVDMYSVLHPDDDPTVWDDLPQVWTREFQAMAQVWAQVNDMTELG